MQQWIANEKNPLSRAVRWVLNNLAMLSWVFFIFFLVYTLFTQGLMSFLFTLVFACVVTYFLQKYRKKKGIVVTSDGSWYSTLSEKMSEAGQWVIENLEYIPWIIYAVSLVGTILTVGIFSFPFFANAIFGALVAYFFFWLIGVLKEKFKK